MTVEIPRPVLSGTKSPVVCIANEYSIGYGCAKTFREPGADLSVTYANEKSKPYVVPLAHELGASIVMPLDVSQDAGMDALFARIDQEWGKLDILVHSIAWAPREDLQGGLLNCPAEGFAKAISPGPLKMRAASGLKDFDLLLNEAVQRAPLGEFVDIMA